VPAAMGPGLFRHALSPLHAFVPRAPSAPAPKHARSPLQDPALTFPWVPAQAVKPWQLFLAMALLFARQAPSRTRPCARNSGDVGKASCRGVFACALRSGAVGEGACIGAAACAGAGPGAIGEGACRGDRACLNNPGPIAKGMCVGRPDANTGLGVCEIPEPDEIERRAALTTLGALP